MDKFWVITKYNLKFLFSNWMSKIFIFLIMGLILVASFSYKTESSKTDTSDEITVSTNDSQVEKILEQSNGTIKIVSENPDIEVNKGSEIQLNIKKADLNETSINLVYTLLDSAFNPKTYAIKITKDYKSDNSLLGIITSLIIFVTVLFIGNIVITAVSLEKTSRMLDIISYKTNSLSLIYGKCTSVLIYIFSVCMMCGIELLILNYFDIIQLDAVITSFGLNELTISEWGYLCLALVAALLVFIQLYVITGLFIVDAAQLQLSQLPMTLLTFSCYAISIFSVTNTKYNYFIDFTQYIPFSFPFGVLLKLFVFNDLTKSFLFTGLGISACFIVATFWIIKNYLLPKKMV